MPLFDNYKASLKNTGATFFQCIGNHDFDRQYQGLHNMELASPVYGEMVYESHFGPTDYSFNIGKAHIVTMKEHQLCRWKILSDQPDRAAAGLAEEGFELFA